jgi:hypothetical protein
MDATWPAVVSDVDIKGAGDEQKDYTNGGAASTPAARAEWSVARRARVKDPCLHEYRVV